MEQPGIAAEEEVPPHVARFRLLAPDPLPPEQVAYIERLLGPSPRMSETTATRQER